MSNRSALSYPSTESGSVGTTIAKPSTAGTMATNTNYIVAETTLSKGLWSVQANTLYEIPTATTIVEQWHMILGGVVPLGTIGPNVYSRDYANPLVASVSTSAVTIQFDTAVVINVTEDNTIVQNVLRMDFTGASPITIYSYTIPSATYGFGALVCTKLA